jgi:hypothetical protein
MTDYAAVLSRRHKGREWSLNGDDYDGLVMLDDGPKPSKKSLDDLWPEVAAEIAAEADAKNATISSARAKLAALGLTEAELAALLGA